MFKIMDYTPLPLIAGRASSEVRPRSDEPIRMAYDNATFYPPAGVRPHQVWAMRRNQSGVDISARTCAMSTAAASLFASNFKALSSRFRVTWLFLQLSGGEDQSYTSHSRTTLSLHFILSLFFLSFVSLTRTSEARHDGTLILSLRSWQSWLS